MILISDFKDIFASKSGGKPLSKVPNIYSLLWQTMTEVKTMLDLPSAIRNVQITNPIYSDIHMYSLPSDVVTNGIIQFKPLIDDNTYTDFQNMNFRQLRTEFKFDPTNQRYGIKTLNGIQYLRVNNVSTSPIVIQSCESLTASGTVALVGVSTSLALDTLQVVSANASFSFKSGAGTSNGLSGTLTTAVDLSTQKDILYWAYLPTVTNITGLQISLGQNSSNYQSATVTADFYGNAFAVGWNLIRVPKLAFVTTAGSPTWTNVLYWAYNPLGTITVATDGFRLDSLVGQLGAIYSIDYYSSLQFQTAAGARVAKPTSDSDFIILQEGDELNLFIQQFTAVLNSDLRETPTGRAAYALQMRASQALMAHYEDFKMKHPSYRQLMTTTYGSKPNIDSSNNW